MKNPIGHKKLKATLSLDLDNQWSYMKIHGDSDWNRYPSYLLTLIPTVLDLLCELELSLTVFVVGKDAELDVNQDSLKQISAAGHEIGNHSHNHEVWTHFRSDDQLNAELALAEERIKKATGIHPLGYRGPGFCLSQGILRVLIRRGYRYDASTFPTFIGPLARAYYLSKSKLQGDEREMRRQLFGTFRDGLRPIKPYYWNVDGSRILEVPVTTFPFLRMPFHMSYVIYLASYSPPLARVYWKSALRACRLLGIEPSILLHPLDFMGSDKISSLAFFPGMNMATESKIEIVRECLIWLSSRFEVMPIGRFVDSLASSNDLPSRIPAFVDRAF